MLESILGGRKKYYIDINFEADAVGSKIITDRGTAGIVFTRNVRAGVTPTDGVVNDPVFGMGYNFDGNVIFSGNKAPGVYNKQYKITLKFVPKSTTSRGIINAGDYPTPQNIKAGWNLSMNQYPSTYAQMFVTTSSGSFARLLPNATNPGSSVMETIEVVRSGTTVTMTLTRLNVSASNQFNPGGENNLHVGGSYSMNFDGSFIGLLKLFRVELF